MKSVRKLSLPKRILSLVLSVMLLAGIAYIPGKAKTVSADLEEYEDYRDISVTKIWDDTGNEGKRPSDMHSIFILRADGEIQNITPVITPEPAPGVYEYVYTWTGLFVFKRAVDVETGETIKTEEEIAYTVDEINLSEWGYSQDVSEDGTVFTSVYRRTSYAVNIELYKTVSGMPEGKQKMFTFELYEKDGQKLVAEPLTLITGNTDPGHYKTVTFENIQIDYDLNVIMNYPETQKYIQLVRKNYIIKEVPLGENWTVNPGEVNWRSNPAVNVAVWLVYNRDTQKIEQYIRYLPDDSGDESKTGTWENTGPYMLKNVYSQPREAVVKVRKVLQDCDGDEIDLTGSYEITIKNDEFINNEYVFTLNKNNPEMSMNIPEGFYYISETSGGEDCDVSFYPEPGENNKIQILQGNEPEFLIIVTNKEKPAPEARVRVIKKLQDCDGDEIDLTGSYTVTLENNNGDKYIFPLNSENTWGRKTEAVVNVPEGIYYISETSGDDYDVSFSPVKDGTADRVEILKDGENEFVITVINKEKPQKETTTGPTTTPTTTQPTTTTTESSTTTTETITQPTTWIVHTTQPSTQPTANTTESIIETTTESSTEAVTEPTIDTTESATNPTTTETETEELEEVEESIPLVNIEITEDIESSTTEESRDNPKTEDSPAVIFALFGIMTISGFSMVAAAKRKFYNLIK